MEKKFNKRKKLAKINNVILSGDKLSKFYWDYKMLFCHNILMY